MAEPRVKATNKAHDKETSVHLPKQKSRAMRGQSDEKMLQLTKAEIADHHLEISKSDRARPAPSPLSYISLPALLPTANGIAAPETAARPQFTAQ